MFVDTKVVRSNLRNMTNMESYIIARLLYKCGIEFMMDDEYENLRAKVLKEYPDDPIHERTWSDDPVDWNLVQRAGINPDSIASILFTSKGDNAEHNWQVFEDYLSHSPSKSIDAVFEWEDAFPILNRFIDLPLNISLKVDGVNAQTVYAREGDSGKLKYQATFSRGRGDKRPFDWTKNASRVQPKEIPNYEDSHRIIRQEFYYPENMIADFNARNGEGLITSRGIATSLLRRTDYPDIEYSGLSSCLWYISGFKTVSESFEWAFENGFDTVRWAEYKISHGQTLMQTQSDLREIMAELKEYGDASGIPSDGIVIQIDDKMVAKNMATDGIYDKNIFALKTDMFTADYCESEVIAVEMLQQAATCDCVAIIKPVQTKSGKTISRVNCFNPDILINTGIYPGATIQFKYKNETTVDLIY